MNVCSVNHPRPWASWTVGTVGTVGWLLLVCAALVAGTATGSEAKPDRAAMVKSVSGEVWLERAGQRTAVASGMDVNANDTIVTSRNGSIGLCFEDNSLVSLGPNSNYLVEDFAFNTTTHEGRFAAKLSSGRLAMISGKLAKQSPDAVKVKTPANILGVRGTEFVVDVTR